MLEKDLDNPGPNAPSSLLLALDPSNASNYLPSIALAAAAAAAAANNSNGELYFRKLKKSIK